MTFSRRAFLKSSTLTAASTLAGISTATRCLALSAPSGQTQRLTSGWEFLREPLGGAWEAWHSEGIAFWNPVTLPHCFNHYDACDPETPYYRGQGWYRTKLKIQNPHPQGRTLLHFEGAGQRTTVFIGETQVGENVGGYNEFVVDITDALAHLDAAAVPLAVCCDNSRSMETMPADVSDFNLYGGLYRNVSLVYVPAIALSLVHIPVEATPDSPAQVTIRLALHNPEKLTDSLSLNFQVIDPHWKQVFHSTIEIAPWEGKKDVAHFTLDKPLRWEPDEPQLYECRVSLTSVHGQNSVAERFGVRHIAFTDHGPFLWNGERLFLKGTQRHEDDAHNAAAVPEEITRREFQMIEEMGANFVRLGHYQQAELVLNLCDEKGIVVWEELPWCRSGVVDDSFKEMGRRLLHTMIDQHFNHPSIAFWGLGNEDDWPGEYPSNDQQPIRQYMQELNELAHDLDPSRMTSFRRADFASDIPDVYSPSLWAGWYRGAFTEYEKLLNEQRAKTRHFLHIEWGADSHAQRHTEDPYLTLRKASAQPGIDFNATDLRTGGEARVPTQGDWSETYACDLFDWHLMVQQKAEIQSWFAGSAQWVFKDFSTPMRIENPLPRVNQKGLVERDLTPKEGYYVFQSWWAQSPMVHIYGHSWPVRWGNEGEERLVRIYSNCEQVELFLNGKSVGVKKRDPLDFPASGLRWHCVFAPGENILHAVGFRKSRTVTDEIRFRYQTEKWGKPAALRLAVVSREQDRVEVEVTVVDASGAMCLDARNRLHFSIAGEGRLADNLGTSTGSRVLEAYNGRARIFIVRTGSCMVGATGEGLTTAALSL